MWIACVVRGVTEDDLGLCANTSEKSLTRKFSSLLTSSGNSGLINTLVCPSFVREPLGMCCLLASVSNPATAERDSTSPPWSVARYLSTLNPIVRGECPSQGGPTY